MASVTPGLGTQMLKASWGLRPVIEQELDRIAAEVEAYVLGTAAAHLNTGEFAESVHIEVDRSSPSRIDRLVVADDPAALSIEYGHIDRSTKRPVEGIHAFTRAVEAAGR